MSHIMLDKCNIRIINITLLFILRIMFQGIWLCEHRDHPTSRRVVVTLNGIWGVRIHLRCFPFISELIAGYFFNVTKYFAMDAMQLWDVFRPFSACNYSKSIVSFFGWGDKELRVVHYTIFSQILLKLKNAPLLHLIFRTHPNQ